MDRLTSMEAFVRASESGSFVAAATLMGISPQMVAKHIQALEKRLGVRLLHRTTRRQRLTEFGAGYLERCKLILAEVESADALAQSTQIQPRGTLRITAPHNFGAHSLVGEHILQGRLEQVLPDYEASAPALSLIYPADRTQTAKLKTFVSHVMGVLG